MKAYIFRIITVIVLLLVLPSMCFSVVSEEDTTENMGEVLYEGGEEAQIQQFSSYDEYLASMQFVCKNGTASLYVAPQTAQFAVIFDDGRRFFSNPYNASEGINDEDESEALASVVKVEYYDVDLNKFLMSSFADSAAEGQITIKKIENGFSAKISMGEVDGGNILPKAVTKKSFEKNILKKLGEFEQNKVLQYYKLYDKDEMDESLLEMYIEQFPELEKQPLYILRSIGGTDEQRLNEYFKGVGYTLEKMEKDLKEAGVEAEITYSPYFVFDLNVTLENDCLNVKIPMETVEYEEHFMLHKFYLMEYFGAAKQSEDGYLFYPDGSGALIDFDKGSLINGVTLYDPIYGYDAGQDYNAAQVFKEKILMPVYGLKRGENAFLTVVANGAASATLYANSGVASSPYSNIYPVFDYVASIDCEHTTAGTTYEYTKLDDNPLTKSVELDILFMSKQDSDYSGMARAYRKYLIDKGDLVSELKDEDNFNLYIATLGAVETNQKYGIFPVKETTVLTDFEQTQKICKELMDSGIDKIGLRLMGWANGGLDGTVYNRAKIVGKLGGKSGLKNLQSFAEKNEIKIYPDIEFTKTAVDKWFDGFVAMRDTAHNIEGKYQQGYTINKAANQTSPYGVMIKPSVMKKYYNKFNKSFSGLTEGLSISSIGGELHGDYSNKNAANREKSLEISSEILKSAAKDYSLMVDTGNAYTYKYATQILNLASSSSAYFVQKASVPFVQIVLHGRVNYAGNAINLSGDIDNAVLKAVENGESLYFLLAFQNTEELIGTKYKEWYSVGYDTWQKDIVDLYNRLSVYFEKTQNAEIQSHEFINNNITRTTYSNGTQIIVNYSEVDYNINQTTVAAGDFAVIS